MHITRWVTARAGVVLGHERAYMVYWWQQFWVSAAWGFIFPIRAIFLYDQGMSLAFYGGVTAAGAALVMLTQGYFGRVADRLESRLGFLSWSLAAMIPVWALITFFTNVWVLASLQVLDTLATGSFITMSNAIISSYSTAGRAGRSLGVYRVAGSAGWILATFSLGFVVGMVGMRGAHLLAAVVATITLVYTVRQATEPPYERDEVIEPVSAVEVNRTRGGAAYRIPVTLTILLMALVAINFSQAAGYTYRSIFFKHVIGTSDVQLGWVMSLQAVLEVPFVLGLGLLSDVWGRRALLVLGFVATGLRWLFLSFITVPQLLYPLQLLHAISFTSTAVIVIAYASDLVPRRHRGMAMGLLNAAQNLGAISAPIVAGYVAGAYDLRVVLRVAALAAAVGVIVFIAEDVQRWVVAAAKRRDRSQNDRGPSVKRLTLGGKTTLLF